MKANYEKPTIEFEEYALDTAIATGCGTIVDLGPEDHEYNGKYYNSLHIYSFEIVKEQSARQKAQPQQQPAAQQQQQPAAQQQQQPAECDDLPF